jgi:ribosomal protein S18
MLPHCRKRRQDGKEHLHKIVVENRCISAGRVLQRQQFGLDALWQRKLSRGLHGARWVIF